MSKIKIKTTINGKIVEFKGIKKQNSIIYKDSDILVSIIIDNILKIKRENDEFKLELNFIKNKQTKVYYVLKKYNQNLEFLLETKKLDIGKNYIEVLYHIVDSNDDDISFMLEFEEI